LGAAHLLLRQLPRLIIEPIELGQPILERLNRSDDDILSVLFRIASERLLDVVSTDEEAKVLLQRSEADIATRLLGALWNAAEEVIEP
jgi:hypothetical protein